MYWSDDQVNGMSVLQAISGGFFKLKHAR